MKRLIVVVVMAALVMPFAPAKADRGIGPQKEEGTVPLAGPGPNGETTGGCWTGHARRAWIISGGATAGPFGAMFAIDEATWDGKFKLEVTGGSAGTEDLDVTFYKDPGHVDPTDPAMQAGIAQTGAYLSREAGGEAGTIPQTTTVALVCLAIGSGANASFTYEGVPPKKKKKR